MSKLNLLGFGAPVRRFLSPVIENHPPPCTSISTQEATKLNDVTPFWCVFGITSISSPNIQKVRIQNSGQ
jgi:hypothetical protein